MTRSMQANEHNNMVIWREWIYQHNKRNIEQVRNRQIWQAWCKPKES